MPIYGVALMLFVNTVEEDTPQARETMARTIGGHTSPLMDALQNDPSAKSAAMAVVSADASIEDLIVAAIEKLTSVPWPNPGEGSVRHASFPLERKQ